MKNSNLLMFLVSLWLLSCQQPADTALEKNRASYNDLVKLYREWRDFEKPPLFNEAPDYRKSSMEKRWPEFKALQTKLASMDTTDWPIPEQVDYHIVWAEMNGYQFNNNILKPWQRDPAFYKVIWMERSDVPAHEGPTNHGTVEVWTYQFPLKGAQRESFLRGIQSIPSFNEQAKANLTGNAKDLWIAGIRDIKTQSQDLISLKALNGISTDSELVEAIDGAIAATDEFAIWLEKESNSKTGPSGIGKENYTWYQQNVHLVPLTWGDEVMLLKRELARAWSMLKLEEHRNRNLPELSAANSPEAYDAMAERSAKSLLDFLANQKIVTVKDYFEPALRAHLGTFIPEEKRNFFTIGEHYDARPLYSHFYHWFELARMDNEPNSSEIRRSPLLYNIFDSRNEGTATAVEEMFMDAGLYDDDPRVREIVLIMIAQRAARGLGSLYAHANEMSMEEAGGIHSEFTPRGWMKTEKELLLFEQHLYLRQPGYGTSYITGKYLLESALADYARLNEDEFKLKDFFDQLNSIGSIPISLGHWEMTGIKDQVLSITKNP
ncbi:MAG: DUF885 family protein [Cytophagia bacterium]|nr:DUF885 family protein [Cytophagia bacterium]